MNKIKFTHNWNNKLMNDIFTTIRKFTDVKHEYYSHNFNKDFEVVLTKIGKETSFGIAKLIAICVRKVSEINEELLMVDTGMHSISAVHKLLANFGITDKAIVLVFMREKK